MARPKRTRPEPVQEALGYEDQKKKAPEGYVLVPTAQLRKFFPTGTDGDPDAKEQIAEMRRVLSDRVRVKFQPTTDPGGEAPVKAGINGYTFVIKRNAEVDVPRALLRQLDRCVFERYVGDGKIDPVTRQIIYTREEVMRFPYHMVADPAPSTPPVPQKSRTMGADMIAAPI